MGSALSSSGRAWPGGCEACLCPTLAPAAPSLSSVLPTPALTDPRVHSASRGDPCRRFADGFPLTLTLLRGSRVS